MTPLAAFAQALLAAFGSGTIGDMLVACLMILIAVVGAASMIVKGISTLTDITPSTRDDLYASKVEEWLSRITAFLDRLALNLDRNQARPPDDPFLR